jgi:hypothetical protein
MGILFTRRATLAALNVALLLQSQGFLEDESIHLRGIPFDSSK